MALHDLQTRTRRALLLTSSIAVVFWASESRDGIHWIIDLDGWKAWLFLLIAHVYYSINWYLVRRQIYPPPRQSGWTNDGKPDTIFGRPAKHVRGYLAREFTDLVALFGGLIMVMNMLIQLEESGVLPL